ncbi:MAG: BrnA antitoxin family protein [Acidobacteriaceae bacterium]
MVTRTLADAKLTPRRKRELAELAARPDTEIDYSDIPPLTEKFWRNAIPNPWYRPVKKQLTVRLDADVIAWLRKQGSGYQTRMNGLLRAAMLRESAPKRRRAS